MRSNRVRTDGTRENFVHNHPSFGTGVLPKRALSKTDPDRAQQTGELGRRRAEVGESMKIATYNVNGVNGRLPVLLQWLADAQPDVVCLQELKAPQEKFPEAALRDAGYGAIWLGQKSWNGVALLARASEPEEIRRALPGDPEDVHSRYIEARVNGIVVGCLYLPNGNPAPGPKFDYKLRWLER